MNRAGDRDARGPGFDTRMRRIFLRSFLFSLFHHPFDVDFRTPNGVPVWTSIGQDISTFQIMKNDVLLGCPAQTKRTTLKRPMDVRVLVGIQCQEWFNEIKFTPSKKWGSKIVTSHCATRGTLIDQKWQETVKSIRRGRENFEFQERWKNQPRKPPKHPG